MIKRYSLDANSLITYFKKETGYEIVGDLLEKADKSEISLFISVVNMTEVIYKLMEKKTETEMEEIREKTDAMPLTVIHEISPAAMNEAARLKKTYHIALADVFGLAVAKNIEATFVTGDHSEMEQIEKQEPISFLWLPAHPKKQRTINSEQRS